MTGLGTSGWMQHTLIWASLLGVAALLMALVLVAWWAIFADRPRGRRRCPRCWYDLSYAPGMKCAECGFVGRSERDFGRTRRRHGIALLAILGCTAVSLYIIDYANSTRWVTYAPTRPLIWSLPLTDRTSGLVFSELRRRCRGDGMTDEQWLALLRRTARGDGGARPPSDEWMRKYERFARLGRYRFTTDSASPAAASAHEILRSIPPRLELSTRDAWPSGTSPLVDVASRHWWPAGTQIRIRTTPRVPGGQTSSHVLYDEPIQRLSFAFPLPPLADGDAPGDEVVTHRVPIDVEVERRLDAASPWASAARWTETLDMNVDDRAESAMEPVRSEAMDDALRKVFRGGLIKWSSGDLPVRITTDTRLTQREPFGGTAVAIRVEVLRNGRLARRLDIWWMGGPDAADRQHAWTVPMHDNTLLSAPDEPDDEWTLQIRGLHSLALRVDGASRFWSGDVTITVPVRTREGSAPPRGWLTEESTTDPVAPAG